MKDVPGGVQQPPDSNESVRPQAFVGADRDSCVKDQFPLAESPAAQIGSARAGDMLGSFSMEHIRMITIATMTGAIHWMVVVKFVVECSGIVYRTRLAGVPRSSKALNAICARRSASDDLRKRWAA